MADIADDEPPSLELLESYRAAGRCWVAAHPHALTDDSPVGYLIADPVDGAAHIEQVSVDPSAARLGIGRALIDHVAAWAERQGLTALTLTTFTDVPWNAPYYTRIGFTSLREDELTAACGGSGPRRRTTAWTGDPVCACAANRRGSCCPRPSR